MLNIPYVEQGKGAYNDLFSRLLKDRIVMLNDEVNVDSAQLICSQLLYLDSVSNEPIQLFINSPGGSVIDGLAIIDIMDYIKSPVYTVCCGGAASMAAVILSCGSKRFATKNSEILVHQIMSGIYGQATDIAIHTENLLKLKERLTKILSDNSLIEYDQMYEMCERDYIMDVEEAIEIGLVDEIIEKRK